MSAAPSRGRVLPHNLEARQCVLGGCLLRPDAAADVLEDATPELFYSPAHRLICQALLSMVADGAPVDLVTVTDRMTTLGTLNKAGGSVYLAELAILAGRPGTGKTALALCEAADFLRKGHPGGIFSLELRSSRLVSPSAFLRSRRVSTPSASVTAGSRTRTWARCSTAWTGWPGRMTCCVFGTGRA